VGGDGGEGKEAGQGAETGHSMSSEAWDWIQG
jgi:hypothetical protein